MPKRELREPVQVEDWLASWGNEVKRPCSLILIGSAALLWHAHQRGISLPLPENSMDADPITDDEEIAALAYDAMIGSDFELRHGWHVNLMPGAVLRELPVGWETRVTEKAYGPLNVSVQRRRICLLQNCDGENLAIMLTRNGPTISESLRALPEMKYLPLDDLARLEYGQLLWRNPRIRARLIAHWTDQRHPYRDRFLSRRAMVEAMLRAPERELFAVAEHYGSSVRAAMREIPPVFGHFWSDSA